MNRWQLRLDLRPLRFEPRREHEVLAQRGLILVDRKSGSIGSELEKNSARLEEINRFEPEAVDDLCGAASGALDSGTHL